MHNCGHSYETKTQFEKYSSFPLYNGATLLKHVVIFYQNTLCNLSIANVNVNVLKRKAESVQQTQNMSLTSF